MAEATQANVPPYSLEAEQCVLGAVLLDNAVWPAVAQALGDGGPAFYLAAHRMVWDASARLLAANLPADVLTVHDSLAATGQADAVGGLLYLNGMVQGTPGTHNAVAYAKIVRRNAVCRQAMALGMALADKARNAAGSDDAAANAIDSAVADLMALQQGAATDAEPRPVAQLLPDWIDQLNERAEGKTDAISTGLLDLDRAMAGGPRRGEVVTLGARPSMGKSAWMLTVACHVAQTLPVLVCSLEDSHMMLVSRLVASAGRVNLAHIRRPDANGVPPSMWTGVFDGVDQLKASHLFVDDTPGMRLEDVERKAQQVKRRAGDLGLVVVDYLQLMEGEGESRAYQLTSIARGLKRMAKRLNCVVLALSQLNREADKIEGPPRLDHLAESDGLMQASDVVGLLWREARRKPKPDNKHKAQVELAKNKNGATDTVQLFFDGATQRFADMEGMDDGTH